MNTLAERTRANWTSLRNCTLSGSEDLASLISGPRGSSYDSIPLSATSCCLSTSLVDAGTTRLVVEAGTVESTSTADGGVAVPLVPLSDFREPNPFAIGVDGTDAPDAAPPVDLRGIVVS